jgi:hypothetical protein
MELTPNDYKDIFALSNEDLEKGVALLEKELDDKERVYAHSTAKNNEEILKDITELKLWIDTYWYVIKSREVVVTPECQGCKEGQLNQQAHYGGCISDPYSDL